MLSQLGWSPGKGARGLSDFRGHMNHYDFIRAHLEALMETVSYYLGAPSRKPLAIMIPSYHPALSI